MKATTHYRMTVYLTQEMAKQWDVYKEEHPDHSFNSVMVKLLEEYLCATVAPTSTIR